MLFSIGVSQGGFSIEHRLGSYSFFSSRGLPVQVWIYFPPETREFSPLLYCLSLIEAQASGPSHLDQIRNPAGGCFNFLSYSIELLLCCESMQRVNSTLNHLYELIELIDEPRIHINNSRAFRHSRIFLMLSFRIFDKKTLIPHSHWPKSSC